jgi:D-alanyl-D-alanine carboxypeptidase/D-alanyl-D-alanine-endopeptidase (penicillin-binding protein 4)
VAIINKKSNNFYAEHVFRAFGYDGSARGAERRMKTFLRRVGADASTLQHAVSVNDGSGLSRKDMTTPRVVVDLLDYMDRHGEREAFVASLARGGEPGTTLKHRLRGVRVRAKTGSLKSVRALSGYVERPDGRRLAFSFIANHYGGPSYRVTQTLDRLTRALARATIS